MVACVLLFYFISSRSCLVLLDSIASGGAFTNSSRRLLMGTFSLTANGNAIGFLNTTITVAMIHSTHKLLAQHTTSLKTATTVCPTD